MPTSITWRAGLDATDLKTGLANIATAGAAAMDSVQKASEGAAAAVGKVSAPVAAGAASMARLKREADNLRASIDPLAAAEIRLQQQTDKANRLFEKGAINAGLHAKALGAARTAFDDTTAALAKGAAAQTEHAAAAGLNRMQLLELSHSARASFDAIAAGANPLRVLAFEGPRVAQALGSGEGGVAGGFKALSAFFNPTVAGMLAIAGAIGVLIVAEAQYDQQHAQLLSTLAGTGVASGLTAAQIDQLAEHAAAAGQATASLAETAALDFASVGRVTSENMGAAVAITRDYATVTGQDATKAVEELAKLFGGDLGKAATELNGDFHFLTAAQVDHIATLDRQGDRTRALTELLQAFTPVIHNAAASLDEAKRPIRDLTDLFSAAWREAGKLADQLNRISATSPSDLLAKAGRAAEPKPAAADPAARARQAADSLSSTDLAATVKALDPSADRIRTIRAEQTKLRRGLANPVPGGPAPAEINSAIAAGDREIKSLQTRGEKKPKRGPTNETDQFSSAADQALDAAKKSYAAAVAQLAVDARDKADAEKSGIDAELAKQITGYEAEEAKIRKAKLDTAKASQLAALEDAKAEATKTADLKKAAVDRKAEADLQAQDLANSRLINQSYDAILQIAAGLATTNEERYQLEVALLAQRKAEADKEAAAAHARELADNAAAVAAGLPDHADALNSRYRAQRGTADDLYRAQAEQLRVSNLGPLAKDAREAAGSSLSESAETAVAAGAKSLAGELLSAANGAETFGQAAQNVVGRVIDQLGQAVLQKFVVGPLEGALSGLFPQTAATATAATSTAALATATATATAALAAFTTALAAGSAGSAAGGASGLSLLLGKADGGPVPGYADGGRIVGPGTGTSDSILALTGKRPIRVSHGEYIVNAAATRRYEPMLAAMNRGQLHGFADGGAIDAGAGPIAQGGGVSGGNVIIHDNRTTAAPPPKVERKSNGDTVISLQQLFEKAIRENGAAVRDAMATAPPKVTRRGLGGG